MKLKSIGKLSSSRSHVRDLEIDRLRGALVILMVIGDYIAGVQLVPSYFKHAPDIGFTIADTVAPAFVFIIGLNFGPSFARRFAKSKTATYRYFVLRYLAMIGIGSVISAAGAVAGQATAWGVLQAIGMAGLIATLVIRLSTWMRLAIGALMLVAYQYFLDNGMLESVLGSNHGGFFGGFSWSALLVLSTVAADFWRKGRAAYSIYLGATVFATAVSVLVIPVSKNRVSLSFILLTLAISSTVFLAVKLFSKVIPTRGGFVSWWGEKALPLYLVHLVVLAAFVLPPFAWWYSEAQWWLVAIQLAVILIFMTLVARNLHRRTSR